MSRGLSGEDEALLKARLRARAQGVALGTVAKEHRADYVRAYEEELTRLHEQAGLEPPVLRGSAETEGR